MSTRSRIGILRKDGKIESIYCHHDGYFEYVGNILFNHYQDKNKIEELIRNGDLSSLAKNIGEKHDFNSKDSTQCKFYGRDRGEDKTASIISESIEDFFNLCKDSWAEYAYIYGNNEWFGIYLGNRNLDIKKSLPLEKLSLIMKRITKNEL